MAEEYLYGITLDADKKIEVWDPEPKSEENDDSNQQCGIDQKLIIKMALLGPEAKEGELNVLQVEAMGLKGPIKIPIALLEIGKTSQIILDLSFPDPPVTFTLIKGSGPVHVVGHNLLASHIEEFVDMEDEDVDAEPFDEWDDEKDGEDDEEEDEEPKKKKNKVAAPPKNKNQVAKNQNQNQNQKKK